MGKGTIQFIIYSLGLGGAERVVSVLAGELVKIGYDVGILTYIRTQEEYSLSQGITLDVLPDCTGRAGGSIRRSMKRIRAIRDYLMRHSPSYVIPFMNTAVRETWMASLGLSMHIIATIRTNPAKDPQTCLQRCLRNFTYSHCDALYAQTNAQKAFFPRYIRKKTFVLPNPLEKAILNTKRNGSGQIHNIVSVGRLGPEKNQALLLAAFAQAKKNCPALTLRIYGEGEEKERLQAQIGMLGLTDCAFLMGRTGDVASALAKSDLFVLSSDFEGMPNALMEAMAVGLPCISTDCPTGPNELIADGENGLLVPVRDSVKMAEAIIYMTGHPKEAWRMAAKARELAGTRFEPRRIAEELIRKIERSLDGV